MLVLTPVALVLIRTRFRHGGWVVAGLVSFAFAWIFRLIDRDIGPYLAMGSHWLWHTFGAITTVLIVEYFYLVEGVRNGGRVSQKTICYLGPVSRFVAGVPHDIKKKVSKRFHVDWNGINDSIGRIPITFASACFIGSSIFAWTKQGSFPDG